MTRHWTVASSAILHTSVSLNRQADAMPTGANGQDWLARSQIWLVIAMCNEAPTVTSTEIGVVPDEHGVPQTRHRVGGKAGLPEEGPATGSPSRLGGDVPSAR